MSLGYEKFGKGREGMKRKGKGRRRKPGLLASEYNSTAYERKIEEGLNADPESFIFEANRRREYIATFGGWHRPVKKRVKREHRRRRRKNRKLAFTLESEEKAYIDEEKEKKEKKEKNRENLKKKHARQLIELRQKFFQDIKELWEKQAAERDALDCWFLRNGVKKKKRDCVSIKSSFFLFIDINKYHLSR